MLQMILDWFSIKYVNLIFIKSEGHTLKYQLVWILNSKTNTTGTNNSLS